MEWSVLEPGDFTVAKLYEVLRLRVAVFVVEQNCPYQELDGRDLEPESRHIVCYKDNQLIAYCRILVQESNSEVLSKIGRVIVDKRFRGGLGTELLTRAVELCHQTWPDRRMILSAQEHLQKFYGKLGFEPMGDVYLEDDIPHIEMIRKAGS